MTPLDQRPLPDDVGSLGAPLSRAERREAEKQATGKQRRKVLAAVAIVLVVVIIAAIAVAAFGYRKVATNMRPTVIEQQQAKAALSAPPASKSEPIYVLVLGLDKRPGQTVGRSDSMMIVRLDPKSQAASTVSIPRDTKVTIPGHGTQKINAASAFGGPALAIRTVRDFTGLPINHYVAIDFRGFASIVDAMGGVWMNVDKTFDDVNGANTGGVSTVTHLEKGYQRLNGQQALTYVRARHPYADGDFARMRHQQQFLAAVAKQALAKNNLVRLPATANAVSANMKTDMTVPNMLGFAKQFKAIADGRIRSYTLPAHTARINGASYVIIEPGAKQVIADFRANRPPAKK